MEVANNKKASKDKNSFSQVRILVQRDYKNKG